MGLGYKPLTRGRKPKPPPTPAPTWVLAWSDDFTSWTPSNYGLYPYGPGWKFQNGTYQPSIISSDGSKLRIYFHTVNDEHLVAAFIPNHLAGVTDGANSLSMKVEFRMRADQSLWQGVPLLWPQSENWPTDGEIDGPEGRFDQVPWAFMHHQGATSGGDQDAYPYPAGFNWNDWHVFRTEWVAGQYAEYFLDGVSIGRSTSRVPSTPMHFVMQTGYYDVNPAPPEAYAEIDYLRVWVIA